LSGEIDMANTIELKVPDIGDFHDVPVIEVLVKAGDRVEMDQSLVTLESAKATMEVPASAAGVIKEVKVKVGDNVEQGAVIAVVEPEGDTGAKPAGAASPPAPSRGAGGEGSGPAQAQTAPETRTLTRPSGAPSPEGRGQSNAPSTPASNAANETGRKPDMECRMLVLGSGPGGYSAAFRAADLGLDTVLV